MLSSSLEIVGAFLRAVPCRLGWATAAMSSPGHPARRPASGQTLLFAARTGMAGTVR